MAELRFKLDMSYFKAQVNHSVFEFWLLKKLVMLGEMRLTMQKIRYDILK